MLSSAVLHKPWTNMLQLCMWRSSCLLSIQVEEIKKSSDRPWLKIEHHAFPVVAFIKWHSCWFMQPVSAAALQHANGTSNYKEQTPALWKKTWYNCCHGPCAKKVGNYSMTTCRHLCGGEKLAIYGFWISLSKEVTWSGSMWLLRREWTNQSLTETVIYR
jgi:hypothetical protein